jgi:hypothetical protein
MNINLDIIIRNTNKQTNDQQCRNCTIDLPIYPVYKKNDAFICSFLIPVKQNFLFFPCVYMKKRVTTFYKSIVK